MAKQITLELPDWANWIAQDGDSAIATYETDPRTGTFSFFDGGRMSVIRPGDIGNSTVSNWRDSKINLNTHGAYIDADGILHRCELVPDMLRRQA